MNPNCKFCGEWRTSDVTENKIRIAYYVTRSPYDKRHAVLAKGKTKMV